MDRKMIEEGVRLILEGIGEDINREGLKGTPRRVAEMYEEIFSGIGQDPSAELGSMFDENHDEIILVKDIPFYSVCEHHMMPFIGKAHIAYVPSKAGKIIGLSKLTRVLDIVAKRLLALSRELLSADDGDDPFAQRVRGLKTDIRKLGPLKNRKLSQFGISTIRGSATVSELVAALEKVLSQSSGE